MTNNSTLWLDSSIRPTSPSVVGYFSASSSSHLVNVSPSPTMEEGPSAVSPAAIVQVTIMSIIIAIALLGNICLILIIVTDLRLRTVHNKMVINLAACGLFTVVTNGPFILSTLAKEAWIFGEAWCQFNGFTTSVYGLAVVLTLAMISINRYQIIGPATPRRAPWVTEKRIPVVIAAVWLVSMLFALPPAVGWSRYEFVPDRAICTLKWSTNISYTVFVFSLGIFLPFIVTFVSYFKIFRTVRANFRRMRSHRGSGKVYPRSEGGVGSAHRPSAVSGADGSGGSVGDSSWSPERRRCRSQIGDVSEVVAPHHLQLPTANGHRVVSRELAVRNRLQVSRTVSDISSTIMGKRAGLVGNGLNRQFSLDNNNDIEVATISPCVSASTLDNPDDDDGGGDSDNQSHTASIGRISDCMVQNVESTNGIGTLVELGSQLGGTCGSRLYKKRDQNGKVAINLTSVDEPKRRGMDFATSPVEALSLALAEGSRAGNILQVQAAISPEKFNHARNLSPIPCPLQYNRPKTAGHLHVQKANSSGVRRLSVRSLRHSFRASSARARSQTVTSQSSTLPSNKDELRMTIMVCAVLISFVLCWAPVTIVSFIAVLNVSIPAPVDKFAVFMMFLSSAVNPVIYGLMNRKFRLGFTRLLCGWRTGKLSSNNNSHRSKTRSRNKSHINGANPAARKTVLDPETGVTTRR